MQRSHVTTTLRLSALLLGPVLLVNCAQIPRSAVPESSFATLSCADLTREQLSAQETKSVAEHARGDSWRAILPFVVAARYANASSAEDEARRRLDLLAAQSRQRGCSS